MFEGREVIHDVNLHINPGETIAFVGTTGRGEKAPWWLWSTVL